MRKVIAIILVSAVICLSACSAAPSVSPAPPSPKATATLSSAGAQAVILPNGAFPKTSYEPVSQPPRYYPDVIKTLIPSNDYGHIWPYIGAYYKVNMMGDLVYKPVYGFCDQMGRVISDPKYTRVEVLEKDGAKLYKASIFSDDPVKKSVSKITLAKPDGTWSKEYDEIRLDSVSREYPVSPEKAKNIEIINWRKDIKLDYLSVRRGNNWGIVDYSGNELLPCTYKKPLLFSEGLASLLSDDEKSVSFIDSTGKTILGPYQAQPSLNNYYSDEYANDELLFSEGRARFYKDGKFGVIDKSGNVVIDPKYDYVSSYFEGMALFVLNGKYGIIGLKGEVLFEPIDKNFYNQGKGIIRYSENFIDKTLNIFTGERGVYSYNADKAYTYNFKNGLSLKTKDGYKYISDVTNINDLNNGTLAISLEGESATWKIISFNGETVAGPFKGQVNHFFAEGFLLIDLDKSETSKEWNPYWKTVYDLNGNRLLPGYYLRITPFDGRYLVQDDTDAGLLDENGRWAIKVPLYEFMGD